MALKLEAKAAVLNLEEEKMKLQLSHLIIRTGNGGREEQGAILRLGEGRKEKEEVGKSRGEQQMTTSSTVALFQDAIYMVASFAKQPRRAR